MVVLGFCWGVYLLMKECLVVENIVVVCELVMILFVVFEVWVGEKVVWGLSW